MIPVLYRVLLRTVISRARLLGLGLMGVVPVLLAFGLRIGSPPDPGRAAYDLVEGYCLGLLAPVVSLVLASAALGDMAEDGTLVHVWLKPVPRRAITAAGLLASLTVAVPLVVLPTVVAATVAGSGVVPNLPGGAAVAATLAVLAYAALFLGLGLRVRRALVWGLAYVLIWEGAVAHAARGAARISIQVQVRSVLAAICSHVPPRNAVATTTGVIAPLAVVALALALTTWWLARVDVA